MDFVGWAVLAICALTTGTLFFSVTIIALRTFSRVKLHEAFKALKKPHEQETLADRVAENAEALVLTCALYRLVFNMVTLLLLVAIFARLRQTSVTIADYIATFVIAAAIFGVFDVAIPHAWAKYAGENFLSHTHKLLIFLQWTVKPILSALRISDMLIRRLCGVADTTPQERQEEQQEEFLNGLEQRRIEGVVDEEEQEMIENVLELSETTAGEIMTPRTDILAVEVKSDLSTVLETINSAGHTRVPVYEKNIDNIIGLIYAKDLLAEIGRDATDFELRDKIRNAYFVPESKALRILLHEFQNQKLHIAVVLDEYGGTAGVVTLEDILEELVGEIADEYEKSPVDPIHKIDKHTIEADARTYVDDLNDEFESNLPEDEDYDTVGGFVFSHLGYIPKTGETFDYENLEFTITAAETRRINRIRIHKKI